MGWPCGSSRRLAEVCREGPFQPRGDGVLQRLGLGVHLAPVEPEHLREEEFDEAMAADDAAGLDAAGVGESCAVAGRVLDPACLVEPLEHAGDGSAFTFKSAAISAGEDDVLRPAQAVDRLEVILHGGGGLVAHEVRIAYGSL